MGTSACLYCKDCVELIHIGKLTEVVLYRDEESIDKMEKFFLEHFGHSLNFLYECDLPEEYETKREKCYGISEMDPLERRQI